MKLITEGKVTEQSVGRFLMAGIIKLLEHLP